MNIHYNDEARRCNFIWATHLTLKEQSIDISAEILNKIIGNKINPEYLKHDYDPNSSYKDTVIYEEILNIIAIHCFGHEWPMNDGNLDMNDFIMRLYNSIKEDFG